MATIEFRKSAGAEMIHKVRSGLQSYIRYHNLPVKVQVDKKNRELNFNGDVTKKQIDSVLGQIKRLKSSHYNLYM